MKHELTDEGEELLPYVAKFGKHMLASKDLDPIYPVLKELHTARAMDQEQALWHSFLYVAWYHLPVSHAAFEWMPKRAPVPRKLKRIGETWPTGIERRSNRGGKVFTHIDSFVAVTSHLPLREWFRNGFVEAQTQGKRHANWRTLNERLQAVWGNGRWAAYKHCEVLRRVHGLPVEAPDMGHRFSSGPREGLATLYGHLEGQGEAAIAVLDARDRDLQKRLLGFGLDVDVEELETILCNFKSLLAGRYYPGHDIDEMQEQVHTAQERGILSDELADEIWEARRKALPNHYLGELNGWSGISKKRMKAFAERGKVLIRRP